MGENAADLDLHVEIGAASEHGYHVVWRAPGGSEAVTAMVLPPAPVLDALALRVPDSVLASTAVVRRTVTGDEVAVHELGRLLFDALVTGDGHALLVSARHRAARDGSRLRVVLRVHPPELARLPWEFLFDSGQDGYLCLDTPLIRYPYALPPTVPLQASGPLRILCMAARPEDRAHLAAEAELDRLRTALADLVDAGLVELGRVPGETWRDLRDALRPGGAGGTGAAGGPWHVFHFVGHGGFDSSSQEGTIALAGERGGTQALRAEQLAILLAGHRSLRLAVLNACETGRAAPVDPFSSVAGSLMRRGLPAVLAMQFPITDASAVECSRTFYEALARQLPVDLAVTEARQAIWMAHPGSLEWGTPVLYMRSLEGRLFDLGAAAADVPAKPVAESVPRDEDRAAAEDWYSRGVGAFYTDEWDAAIEAFARVLAIDPGHPRAAQRLADAKDGRAAASAAAAAEAAVARQDWKEAAAQYERLLAAAPDHPGAQDGLTAANREIEHDEFAAGIALLHRYGNWKAVVATAQRFREAAPAGPGDRFAFVDDLASSASAHLEEQARRELGGATQPGPPLTSRAMTRRLSAAANALAFAPDGSFLVAACDWNLVVTVALDGGPEGEGEQRGRQSGPLWHAAFMPDGQSFATAGSNGTVTWWDRKPRKRQRQFSLLDVQALAIDAQGKNLAVASEQQAAHVYSLENSQRYFNLPMRARVRALAYRPGSSQLAVAGDDGRVRIWDTDTKLLLHSLTHPHGLTDVLFSPDGRHLATASDDCTARVWDAETGVRLSKMRHARRGERHSRAAHHLAYTPDGIHLATFGWDGVLRAWNAATGEPAFHLAFPGSVRAGAFSPDGTMVAVGLDNRDLHIRDWPPSPAPGS
ncbi:CHAT domain-containing protein [Yinghuangia soli]|uniref:CHAT domain-containing protein n=1 Tax=Yinghuangia soli TaxID=2908204 RepID=A0AA41Q7Z4_9ACTN|nr:CHAT domain-containing protein [Yinghuangia soli]MCF2533284.1 CHAT domain-containing protein [Yinghuangia soli]